RSIRRDATRNTGSELGVIMLRGINRAVRFSSG
ncbi:MAG: hypothetical protein QOH82_3131, partial [Mycobacterium sp.]|nr:hypothetical protein [Mycobacterium sp.]